MSLPHPISVDNFSHVCIGVPDMDTSVSFYTHVLGMDVVFDVNLDGAGLDSVTGGIAKHGRMGGGLIVDVMIELLSLGSVPLTPDGPHLGYTNISFRVANLDDTHEALAQHHSEVPVTPPVDIAGVRMLFVHDPDGTPIELIELPGGAESTVQLWRPMS